MKGGKRKVDGERGWEGISTTSTYQSPCWELYIHSLPLHNVDCQVSLSFQFLDKKREAQRGDTTDYDCSANMGQWGKEGTESDAQKAFVLKA